MEPTLPSRPLIGLLLRLVNQHHAQDIDAALHAGASAYVLKSAQTVDIASILRQASSGAVFHAPTSAAPGPAG